MPTAEHPHFISVYATEHTSALVMLEFLQLGGTRVTCLRHMEPSERLQENLNLWIELRPQTQSPLNVSHVDVSVTTLTFLCYC